MRYNDVRCWAVWSESAQDLIFCAVSKSDCDKYLRMIPAFFRNGCEVVRMDLCALYRRKDGVR